VIPIRIDRISAFTLVWNLLESVDTWIGAEEGWVSGANVWDFIKFHPYDSF
jgi:hypothetical protein